MNIRSAIACAALLPILLLWTGCTIGGDHMQRAQIIAPAGALVVATLPPPTPKAAGTSVMVYIKLVIDKRYGVLAHLLGGRRDSILQRTSYDPARPWWENPLIAYTESPLLLPDVVGRADAQVITGQGSSGNVTITLALTPHADLAVKTFPKCDCVRGTISTTISASAEFYDGDWVEMVHEVDREVTFSFDTCDPLQHLKEIGQETRTIPAFAIERLTRDQKKWEPKTNWPVEATSGDWRVVIYAKEAKLNVTTFRRVDASADNTHR